jgi:threonine synthase
MQYFSTNRKAPHVSFREAVRRGQPDDQGLYFPEEIPRLPPGFLARFHTKSNEQIAFEVIRPYIGDDIADERLYEICAETVNFPFPLVPVSEDISALELFHGPTLAFKDVGARFMSRCLQHFSCEKSEKTIVIVATSGDTGGAVANGFYGVEGVEVVILFPKDKVSRMQELQLTALGGNVTALEVKGVFDDCQALAKQALGDAELQKRVFMTSANSINVARWLPQQFYYFYAIRDWEGPSPVISVPSGNFGNICAGILAHISGLPVAKFIAACNANDVIPEYLRTGEMKTRPSVRTLSNAMDVGNPSNFVRILEIFGHNFLDLKQKLEAVSISDRTTGETMREVYDKYRYILDPHGAVGYRALADTGRKGIFLETAHPVKFDSVNNILDIVTVIPDGVGDLFTSESKKTRIAPDYQELREILRKLT